MLWWSLVGCVLEPAPGIWFQFEPDPSAEAVPELLGAWEDGTVVGRDASGALVRMSPGGEATPIPFPGELSAILPDDTLVGVEAGRPLASYDRGASWTAIAPPGEPAFACCWTSGSGDLVGTSQQGDPWVVHRSRNGGRTWSKGTVKAPPGQVLSVAGGVMSIQAVDGVYQWKLPGGRARHIPFEEVQAVGVPTHSTPTGLVLFDQAPWFHPYGALPWTWSRSWEPDGSVTQYNTLYGLNLPLEGRSLSAVGLDGRLYAEAGGARWRSVQPLDTSGRGRAEVLRGPGCDAWTWPAEVDIEGSTGTYTDVPVRNQTGVAIRVIRTNCTGWCEDPDNLIEAGAEGVATTATGNYVIAVGEDGVCYGLYPIYNVGDAVVVEAP